MAEKVAEAVYGLLFGWMQDVVGLIATVIDAALGFMSSPLSFDWSFTLMSLFQAVSVGIVFVIALARGVTTGVLLSGGTRECSVGQYLYQSVVPVCLIAAAPVVTGAITQSVTALVSAMRGAASGSLATAVVGLFTPTNETELTVWFSVLSGGVSATPVVYLIVRLIATSIMVYYLAVICMQCVKRWVMIEVLSVIAPLTCIMTAVEDSGDFVALLKAQAMAGVVTALQLALLQSVPTVASAFSGPLSLFMAIATLSAIKACPNWIERYTGVPSVAGRTTATRVASSAAGTVTRVGMLARMAR